jgi:hypothetical protein
MVLIFVCSSVSFVLFCFSCGPPRRKERGGWVEGGGMGEPGKRAPSISASPHRVSKFSAARAHVCVTISCMISFESSENAGHATPFCACLSGVFWFEGFQVGRLGEGGGRPRVLK